MNLVGAAPARCEAAQRGVARPALVSAFHCARCPASGHEGGLTEPEPAAAGWNLRRRRQRRGPTGRGEVGRQGGDRDSGV